MKCNIQKQSEQQEYVKSNIERHCADHTWVIKKGFNFCVLEAEQQCDKVARPVTLGHFRVSV